MSLRELVFDKPIEYELKLKKNNKETIGILEGSTVTNLEAHLEDTWKLEFTVSYYITDSLTHQRVKNPLYDLVTQEKKVILNDEVEFVIREVSEGENDKKCRGYSSELKLNKRRVVFNNITRQLKKDAVNTANGLFDEMENDLKYWKIGYLDPEAKIDRINGGTSNKIRFFDSVNKSWLSFIREDMREAYGILPIFNTLTKTLDVYDRKTYGRKTGFRLSKANYVNTSKKDTDSNEIITVLRGYGKEGMPLNSVNPLGDFVENFDYYRSDMSPELNAALDKYYRVLDGLFAQWITKQTELLNIQQQKVQKNSDLKAKSEELVVLERIKSSYVGKDNVQLTKMTNEVNAKKQEITTIMSAIQTLKNQEDAKITELTNLTNSMRKEQIKENNVLIFSADLLEELNEFIYEGEVSNEAYYTASALYEWVKKESIELSKPNIVFDIEVDSFIDGVGIRSNMNNSIKFGDYIIKEDARLGEEEVKFIGYVHNPQSKSLRLVFSNKDNIRDITKSNASAIKQAKRTTGFVETKKWSWYQAKNESDSIRKLIDEGLVNANNNIRAMQGRNKIQIDENGTWLYDTQDANRILAMVAGLIVISDDGMKTCKVAIDASGIIAEQIVGKIILSTKTFIGDEKGLFTITGEGLTVTAPDGKVRVKLGIFGGIAALTLYDKNGNEVVLDENGIVNNYQFMFGDSLDAANPVIIPVNIDDGVKSFRKVSLYIRPEEFRAHSKGASAGGGIKTTVDGGGNLTSLAGGGGNVTFTSPPASAYNPGVYVVATTYADGTGSHHHLLENTLADMIYNHTHRSSFKLDSHFHTINTIHGHTVDTSHTHEPIYGIYKGDKASNVKVYVNDVLVMQNISIDTTIDITNYMRLNSVNFIKITSDTLGRIALNLSVKAFISH